MSKLKENISNFIDYIKDKMEESSFVRKLVFQLYLTSIGVALIILYILYVLIFGV